MIHVVRLADAAPQPWRNGGGITHELLAWPAADAWQVRISIAEIARDGPFSAWAGMERHFAVVQGAGVVLSFGDDDRRLTPASPPLAFEGAAAPECTLIDGPTLDLNLLVRHDAGHGSMRAVVGGEAALAGGPLRAVFTQHAAELLVHGRSVAALPAQSLAYSTAGVAEPWQLRAGAPGLQAWWLGFERHAR